MKFLPVLAIFFAGVLAVPTSHSGGGGVEGRSIPDVCPGTLYGQALCCATDVAGVADLDCSNPTIFPTTINNFKGNCASIGKRARCCTLPVLGLALLCQSPGGT